MYSDYSGKLALISLAISVLMLCVGGRTFVGKEADKRNYFFVFICVLVYSVLGFAEQDTYHLYQIYEKMITFGEKIHVEDFYYWLVNILPHNYLLWRLFVWGVASILFVKTAKMLDVNTEVLCFVLPLWGLSNMAYARGSLGLSLMLFSYVFFIENKYKNKRLLSLMGVAGLCGSIFLHDSIFVFLAILFLSYFIPLNKNIFIISLLIFPIIYMCVQPLLAYVLQNVNLLSDGQGDILLQFGNAEKFEYNINVIIMNILRNCAYVCVILILAKRFLFENVITEGCPKSSIYVFKYAYFMLYFSFLLLGQRMSSWVSLRAMHAGSFALLLSIVQGIDSNIGNRKRSMAEQGVLIVFVVIMLYYKYNFIVTNW